LTALVATAYRKDDLWAPFGASPPHALLAAGAPPDLFPETLT
jgi:hypothetical protein